VSKIQTPFINTKLISISGLDLLALVESGSSCNPFHFYLLQLLD
jgi:hypothetical protein